MAERRLHFTVQDDEEVAREGEVIIARAWRADIEASPRAAFAIVLVERPPANESPKPFAANVVVCVPAAPVRLLAAAAEAAVAYGSDSTSAPPIRLSRQALAAFANGVLLAAHRLSVSPRDVFDEGTGRPQLHLLARDLLSAARRAEACWRTMDEALSWPRPPARILRPERLRARLGALLERLPVVPSVPPITEAIARLRRIAAEEAVDAVASSAAELREDVALMRGLADRPEETAALASLRAYLEGARPPPGMPALLVDHATTREQLSFAALLSQPHALGRMRATFEVFQAAYASEYVKHHRRYWQASARLRSAIDEAAPTAQALAGLNTLRGLGAPVGRGAIAAYQRLTRARRACPNRDLESILRHQPVCPECGVTLADSPPSEEAEEVLRRMCAALGRQQARLASEAVRRILARGGERIEQFLQIVQASDLAGLARLLDDELLAFLGELLAQPVSPTPEALSLFEELARTHPSVSEDQVDGVIETLRRLLTERLALQRAADPSQAAAFPLATAPPRGTP